jgi:hypothetical protein
VRVSIEAGDAPSSADSAGAGLPQGGPAPHGRTRSRSGKHPAVSAPLSLTGGARRARKSNDSRVLVSRVDCRGWREASSPCRRGEPRGEPRWYGVARDEGLVLTGRARTLRAKGCESLRANVQGNAKGFARPQGRDRTDGRHPELAYGVISNRMVPCRVLAMWGVSFPDERRETRRRTRDRRSRASTHGATEDVRGCDVG